MAEILQAPAIGQSQDLVQPDSGFCKFCQKLIYWEWQVHQGNSSQRYIEHHPTYSSLCKSASEGCGICSFLRRGMIAYRRNYPSHVQPVVEQTADDDTERKFYLSMTDIWSPIDKKRYCEGFEFVRSSYDDMSDDSPLYQVQAQGNTHPGNLGCRVQGLRPDLTLAADWLQDCINNHLECTKQRIDVSPTRVLQINPSETLGEYDIRLVELNGTAESYVALSHCWGSCQPLRTTAENLQAHRTRIPFNDLPKSFQDAVIVTTSLGADKLWIDSLCIIQDSAEDWERECPRMGDIYENALCTIAACDAPDDSVGFLNEYPTNTRYNIGNSIVVRCIASWTDRSTTVDEISSLLRRGWVLQEKFLSSRILAFKSERMQWQCNKHYMSDDVRFPYKPSEHASTTFLKQNFRELVTSPVTSIYRAPTRLPAYDVWNKIICTYSTCNLTKGADKLPALSGLAQRFSTLLNDNYIAGIWGNDICRGLTWHRPPWWYYNEGREGDSHIISKPIISYRAPSWSWASIDGQIWLGHWFEKEDLICLSVKLEQKGLDPFGQLTNALLCVNGQLKSGILRNFNPWSQECSFGQFAVDSIQDVERFRTHDTAEREVLVLLIGYGLFSTKNDDDHSWQLWEWENLPRNDEGEPVPWQRKWYAIAIEKASCGKEEDVFRRVGLVQGEDRNGSGWFDGCPRRDLRLV